MRSRKPKRPHLYSPPPRRRTMPGPRCSEALSYTVARINGLRCPGSFHQRSSSNSRCKHKNDDIFLMTTEQLKLQECISSPFSGQYSQHVCAFNLSNTAAKNHSKHFSFKLRAVKIGGGKTYLSVTCVDA